MTEDDGFPILLSLRVAFATLILVGPIGVAIAHAQARRSYRGKGLVDALLLLPLILPPSVVGFFLVMLFGRRGVAGPLLNALGVRVVFSPVGAVLASMVVALPILVKTCQPALEAVPREFEDVGRTLGLGPFEVFFRVTLRAAWRGVAAGLVLAFARAIGEFGATLMVAGNIRNATNTMPLEIFAAYQAGDDGRAMKYVLVLTTLSGIVAVVAARLAPREASG
ncbi:MAG: molybdate ABC transporter permease subunit [Polyangiaceae bacterium]